jgi:hypothetical protein
MKQKNKDLYRYHQQLQGGSNDIVFHLLTGRIKDFYKNNGLRINTLLEKIEKMQREFFQYGEDGFVKFQKVPVPNSEEMADEPVIQEGKSYDDYIAQFNELMERDTTIVF